MTTERASALPRGDLDPRGLDPRARARFRRALLAWFDGRRRDLPWRRDRDPYRVWVSEVMLQQTRIEVVIPAWERFLAAFPDLRALAAADADRVLSFWSGLGYYSRARSLHRAARELVATGAAEFPRELDAALRLPGVGAYTAAAVLSIAYDLPHAAVDGNVVRVLSRLARLGLPGARGEPHRSLADALLARRRPGDWNQAVMELGQTVCTPRSPGCDRCPVGRWCRARGEGAVRLHPPPRPRAAVERHELRLTVLRDGDGRVLLERGAFPHLAHLWLPPSRLMGRGTDGREHPSNLAARGRPVAQRAAPSPAAPAGSFKHSILHREFHVRVDSARVTASVLERAGRARRPRGVERRVFTPAELAAIGRSSLLSKALRAIEPRSPASGG